ncbi:SURF1 family protein [Luteimonas sp. SX5]|uniref:SURF1-like protein n=1 Tax=Luteimonas galliterrae TaxID=2940486 RepID=A0ABT0MM29_9GAMM|nr:SURF1 family protein [Luteimonas galliterrae]MCL1635940.1 SURF1 family protein [Luteimonas galliterrae]
MALFAGLGRWQLGRMHEKQAMLDAAQAVLTRRQAKPLSSAGDAARRHDYDWAAGEGRFAAAPAVLLDNQQRDGRPGVRAYRLFQPASDAMPLLVELGWLPLPGDRRMPAVPAPQGVLRLEGLLLPPPSAGIAAAPLQAQDDGSLLALSLDMQALPAALRSPPIAARILRPDPANKIGYARDLDILPNTLPPERHLGYAVQWFALALAVLVTAFVLTFRKRRPRR